MVRLRFDKFLEFLRGKQYFAPVFPFVFLFVLLPEPLLGQEIKPFKDDLFSYGDKLLKQADNGDYLLVNYDKQVDLYDRDQVPIRKVKRKYVKTGFGRFQTSQEFKYDGREIEITFVARRGSPKFTVIFIHGRDGDRRLGMKDYIFGGNFNRLKNLAVQNRGLYITQTINDFSQEGVEDTRALIQYLRDTKKAPNIIVVCASMGGQICNKLAHSDRDVARLSGIVLLGAIPDNNLENSHAMTVGLPVVIAHGTSDSVYAWQSHLDIYRRIKSREARYPVRLILFENGVHGTPIRMIDWRDTLNWIFRRS